MILPDTDKYKRAFDTAVVYHQHEVREAEIQANRVRVAANEVRNMRLEWAEAMPDGAGLEAVRAIPWAYWRYFKFHDDERWILTGGVRIEDGLAELPEIVRILGVAVTEEINGILITCSPGDTAVMLSARYWGARACEGS